MRFGEVKGLGLVLQMEPGLGFSLTLTFAPLSGFMAKILWIKSRRRAFKAEEIMSDKVGSLGAAVRDLLLENYFRVLVREGLRET